MSRRDRRERYHHGDLRAALVDTALDLIAERGVRGFSLAEASRRLGVSVSAPYRHFADKDELMAAAAVRASGALAAILAAEIASAATPGERLVAAARAYVRFAAADAPLFEALVAVGLDKRRHPEIEAAAQPVTDAFLGPAGTLAGGDAEAGERLALAVAAAAHGHASLLLQGAFGQGPDAVELASARAAASARALVAGREALLG